MLRILIIDDESHARSAITLMLVAKGFDAVAAENGLSGLKVFGTSRFDLVIVDLFMPGMDGVKLIKALRERDASLPVIAMSGVQLGLSDRTALDYLPRAPGLANIVSLQKPFRPAQLLQAIKNAIAVAA